MNKCAPGQLLKRRLGLPGESGRKMQSEKQKSETGRNGDGQL
jgi:hypothetical protein